MDNLDLGIETCFYDGMSICLHMTTVLFPLILCLASDSIDYCVQLPLIAANSVGSNPVAILATLLFFLWSKILRNIIAVFTVAKFEYPDHT